MKISLKKYQFIVYAAFFIMIEGCGLTMARPKLELSLASAAFNAAKEANASILAPNLYRKAEIYFLKAKSSYKKKYFNQAKQYALLSQELSEQAEFLSIKKATLEN